VLLVIKCLGYGGAERLLVDMASHRDAGAFDYSVAYVLRREAGLVPAMEATGVPVHALGAEGNWDVRWLAALRRLLTHGGFDIVHSHLPYAATLTRLVARTLPRQRRPRLVYTEHSDWDKMAVLVKGLNRVTVGLDDALVVVSDSARDALPGALRSRARVVIHGVDLERSAALVRRREELRRQVRAEFEVPDDEVLALTVANLRPEKGYDVLLDAAGLLAERGAPLRLVAVGRGPLRDELEERRRALHLGDRFRFAGPRDDALALLGGADLFVLASRQEGLPVAFMEAASLGLAIVASAVGEIPRLITPGVDGLVVPPGRPDALADAIARVGADESLRHRLGQGALARSAAFDVAKATKEIESLYTELLDRRS
jgi:glycosyltransferase involved in cell wall biosynthesis